METPPHRPVVLDMTPEGEFREPPPPSGLDRLLARFGRIAAVVAVVALLLAIAALAFAALAVLIPVGLAAAALAWVSFRWRMWRRRRQGLPPEGREGSGPARFVIFRR